MGNKHATLLCCSLWPVAPNIYLIKGRQHCKFCASVTSWVVLQTAAVLWSYFQRGFLKSMRVTSCQVTMTRCHQSKPWQYCNNHAGFIIQLRLLAFGYLLMLQLEVTVIHQTKYYAPSSAKQGTVSHFVLKANVLLQGTQTAGEKE